MFKIMLAFSFLSLTNAHATPIFEKYSSVARGKNKNLAYHEQHDVEFQNQRVQKAKTIYIDANGKTIGEMASDFTNRITLPDYDYTDHRTGERHGIRHVDNKIVLWRKAKDDKEESKQFEERKFDSGMLLVGCQGLHYYLIDNFDQVRERKKIPIAYFMPGKLDYFRFTLNVEREDDEHLYLDLSIDNFILKMFTSSLKMKYRKSDRRLVEYAGLSNITDDKNQMQNVVINYTYDSKLKETL